jgi:SAM-dependent methyltransferase
VPPFPRREELRDTFDAMATRYHRARPSYPASLFDDLVALGALRSGTRVLEIGAGTGIATLELARRGLSVVAVERAEEMAVEARENLAGFDVEIVTGAFEHFETDERFAAVVAFSSFHWLDPEARYELVARVLPPGGVLAVADQRRTVPASDPFFAEAEGDHAAVLGAAANAPAAPVAVGLRTEIEASPLFELVATRDYGWSVDYTAAAYLELLDSFPWYAALDPVLREDLYVRLAERIDARGSISAPFEALLHVARRV